jgi:hypothetical protein
MDPGHEIETAVLRRMTPAAKLAVMASLWRQAWALMAAGVRARHPTWPDARVADAVRERFRHDGS